MRQQPQQYGEYRDQSTISDETAFNTTPLSETRSTRRDFLSRKYEDDLANAKVWRRFTLIASIIGVAVIFLGSVGGIVTGIISGALVGGLVGGISTLAGLITNIFLHLVYDPAEKANEQLERTTAMIVEEEHLEEQYQEDLQLLERLDEVDQKEYIKQRLFSHISSTALTPTREEKRKTGKYPRNQRNP